MSNSTNRQPSNGFQGTLHVVATPIGNLEDITIRAIQTLKSADLIAAEDTRNTRRLLSRYEIENPMISLHEHNEERRSAELVAKMKTGVAIALVSDAGTPTLSDPGFRLVKEAIANRIKVVPIPGPSAAVAALSVSGLPTDAFVFLGFPPRKKAKRRTMLKSLIDEKRTLIFYESPKRIKDLLSDLLDILGNRQTVLSREMTKRYEEFIRGDLHRIVAKVRDRKEIKGECTLLVEGAVMPEPLSTQDLQAAIRDELESSDAGMSALSKEIAKRLGLPKSRVYEEALKIKGQKRKETE